MHSNTPPAATSARAAAWRRILPILTACAVALMGLVAVPGGAEAADPTPNPTPSPGPWPTTWRDYRLTDGTPIRDVNGDQSPTTSDLTSGPCSGTKCTGPSSTVLFASDGTNAFFRMRMGDDNNNTSQGGLFANAFLVQIADSLGNVKAVVGVNGKPSDYDYVYVTDSVGGTTTTVYKYPFTGAAAGTRWISDGAGQYFLDFQVPLSALTQLWPGLTPSTPLKLYYGSSAAANLAVINKDFMLGDVSVVDFTNVKVVKFVPPTYTVGFDANEGTLTGEASSSVAEGDPVSQPSSPTRIGYTFAGWWDARTDGNRWNFSTPVTVATTLYAHWTVNNYAVTFDTRGGSTNPSPRTADYGTTITPPAEPTRTGYTFAGWYADGTNWDFSQPVTSALTLTARWTAKTYQVSFDSNGGSAAPDPQAIDYDQKATAPSEPTLANYTFTGWYDDDGNPWDFATDTVTGDTTLTAHWKVNTYQVSFDTNGGSTAPAPQSIDHGTTAIQPTDPTRTGYTFTGWDDGDNPWDFATDTVTGDATLTAHWKVNTYQVSFDTDGGSDAPGTQAIDYGSTVTAPATDPARTGYTFTGWYDGDNPWDFDADKIAADSVLTAHWSRNPANVTFETNGGSASPAPTSVAPGDLLVAPSDPTRTGYTFAGWYDEATGQAWDFDGDTVTGDTTLTAHWKVNTYLVSFDTNGGSTAPATRTIDHGTAATAPAADPTRTGYTFTGWYADSIKWDFSQPVTSTLTLTAHWAAVVANTCTVTFDAAGGSELSSIQVGCGHAVAAPTAPTKRWYTFTGWTNRDGTPYTFGPPVDRDLTLVAQWAATDSDGDGLSDQREAALGTAPKNPDSDHDGIPDGLEVAGGLNGYGHCPTSPVAADSDHDGLSDGREVHGINMGIRVVVGRKKTHRIGLAKTNPCSADTDYDGISDGHEVGGVRVPLRHTVYRTNPLRKDTDADGLTDKQEETGSRNRKFHHAPTNPLNWDTDHGGIGDGVEVKAGSNPLDIHSSPWHPGIVLPKRV